MAKKDYTYRGKTLEELQKLSMNELAELLPSKQRRTIKRGFSESQKIMLKKLNHIAIVVPDVKKAKEIYQLKFNAVVSDPKNYPQHGVTVVFV